MTIDTSLNKDSVVTFSAADVTCSSSTAARIRAANEPSAKLYNHGEGPY